MSQKVDIAVIGGSTWAVAAAVAAAEQGASVFLAAPRPYLGEDMCATLRLSQCNEKLPKTDVVHAIFGPAKEVAPIHVKKTLDDALVKANVGFLFGCYATDPLLDENGAIGGFAMASRAGLETVTAKVVIDATERAWFTRKAGAESAAWPKGKVAFKRYVVMPGNADGNGKTIEHELAFDLPDGSFVSFAAAEQQARSQTYADGQMRASENLFHVPPDPISCQRSASEWNAADPDIGHFQPRGLDGLYVLSGCADIPRPEAERLLCPCALTEIAAMVGKSAAQAAKFAESRKAVSLKCPPVSELPVLGTYDVVVVGGGTSGAPAAIAASRQGARTLVLEYQEGLGGTGTLGMIGKAYHGQKIGFSEEVPFPDEQHNVEHKMEWYRCEIRKAGGEIWLGVLGTDALVSDNQVAGVVVATPEGRGIIRAKVVVDSTGNGDIAVAAGTDCMYGATEDGFLAMQGAGLPSRPLGTSYVNTDYLFVDENDMQDVWRSLVGARMTMDPAQYDCGPLIQTRERRRVVGDHVLTYLDQMAERTYADTIVYSASDYDSHGYPNDPFFAIVTLEDPGKRLHPAPGGSCYTPFRCLLPRRIQGIIVTGLGMSMKRDASAMVRMQFDFQNQGYAAGVAAAMAASQGCDARAIDIRALQRHLVTTGALPKEVLEHEDSFPLSDADVSQAVCDLALADRSKEPKALAVVLSHHSQAKPELLKKYDKVEGESKLKLALILGFLGEKQAAPVLIAALENISEWEPRILQGNMAEYAHLPTRSDAIIMALGCTRDPSAVPALLKKLETLDAEVTLSHHRAIALALEHIRDTRACRPLAELLSKPGMNGHAMVKLEPLFDKPRDKRRRIGPLRELILARALYRCGDHEGLGKKILGQYAKDIRGLFRLHAMAIAGAGVAEI